MKVWLSVIVGLLLILTGCASAPDVDINEKSTVETTKNQETPKENESIEDTSKEDISKDKTIVTESEAPKNNTVANASSEKKETTAKPAPVKKTETAGTTAHIPVKLVKTIDGDTIKILYNGQEVNVRYLLIDTPETSHPQLGKQPFGEEAKERNRQLVNSGELSIEFDVGERYDKYDRLLAYIYVDGKSVQETLLSEGLARVAYVYPPNTRHLTPYEEAQAVAKKKGLGIWSVENYATDSGFNSDAVSSKVSASTGGSASKPATSPNTTLSTTTEGKEIFKNCTELRKKYPSGVPQSHPAYQAKMDRDKDGYACEK
ncbi:thermonuclease family protein [Sporosarcina thermotolerans]|uniref:Thermonuclease family protein n=1 Tax=Sporosarcina thermotolerans TaxID=633404 RepID=A0AAW9AAA1_9BACL|nr:thermonuclease family protein [Sporosarcina thermotolerans]MDW0116058.1 thermonuclease family protein [Sporosarcina thermotolerans]